MKAHIGGAGVWVTQMRKMHAMCADIWPFTTRIVWASWMLPRCMYGDILHEAWRGSRLHLLPQSRLHAPLGNHLRSRVHYLEPAVSFLTRTHQLFLSPTRPACPPLPFYRLVSREEPVFQLQLSYSNHADPTPTFIATRAADIHDAVQALLKGVYPSHVTYVSTPHKKKQKERTLTYAWQHQKHPLNKGSRKYQMSCIPSVASPSRTDSITPPWKPWSGS